jgi:hypothetical protein
MGSPQWWGDVTMAAAERERVDRELRIEALMQAVEARKRKDQASDVVVRAEAFYEFLAKSRGYPS